MLYGLSAAVLIMLAALLVFVVETVCYYARIGWYYRLGPALKREEWQSSSTPAAVLAAMGPALRQLKAGSRQCGEGFAVRRHWWAGSFWPRVYLRVEARPGGAAIVYEVRPFLSPALLVVPLLILLPVTYRISTGLPLPVLGTVALIVVAYVVSWPWELRTLRRLTGELLVGLAPVGVRVCPACRYDLHRLPPGAPCPECGATPATQDHDPPALRHRASR